MLTVRDVLREAERALGGLPGSRREALELWALACGGDSATAWLGRGQAARPDPVERFREAVTRRRAGEPFAYIAGRAPFRTLTVGVDRRALIPRPETEGLVEHALRWAQARWPDHAWGDALDVGTGSGCIALSLAAEGRFRRVVGVDRSAAALAVARANRSLVSSPTPVDFEAADLFPAGDELFDVIVANPPYLTEVEHTALDPGVRDFEPREALVSGADGLHHTRSVLTGARARLAPGGFLGIEVDCRRAGATLASAVEAGWRDARIEDDVFGRPRYVLATREIA